MRVNLSCCGKKWTKNPLCGILKMIQELSDNSDNYHVFGIVVDFHLMKIKFECLMMQLMETAGCREPAVFNCKRLE